MFCPKCGGILMPKKEDNKKILACSCGYKSKDVSQAKLKEIVAKEKEVEVVDREDVESMPEVETECPKCHNMKAYFWLVQTRASDEPETKFYRCTKCKHTWRDYS
ncbi:transcription factor S [candidate division KSB1 bacterium]